MRTGTAPCAGRGIHCRSTQSTGIQRIVSAGRKAFTTRHTLAVINHRQGFRLPVGAYAVRQLHQRNRPLRALAGTAATPHTLIRVHRGSFHLFQGSGRTGANALTARLTRAPYTTVLLRENNLPNLNFPFFGKRKRHQSPLGTGRRTGMAVIRTVTACVVQPRLHHATHAMHQKSRAQHPCGACCHAQATSRAAAQQTLHASGTGRHGSRGRMVVSPHFRHGRSSQSESTQPQESSAGRICGLLSSRFFLRGGCYLVVQKGFGSGVSWHFWGNRTRSCNTPHSEWHPPVDVSNR